MARRVIRWWRARRVAVVVTGRCSSGLGRPDAGRCAGKGSHHSVYQQTGAWTGLPPAGGPMGSLIAKALATRGSTPPVQLGAARSMSRLTTSAAAGGEAYMRAHGAVGTVWQIVH